jgi:DNA polymerase-1
VTPEQRSAAKAVNFGNLYGQGADGLMKTAKHTYGVDMSREEAAAALHRFHATYPDLAAWKRQQAGWALQFRRVTTRLGLVRDFDVQGEGYLKGEACNIPIQGSAAEILLCTLVRLPRALEGTTGQLYHNVHDELLLTAHADDAERVAEILRETMIAGFLDVFPEGVAMTGDLVDVHVGQNWGEVH